MKVECVPIYLEKRKDEMMGAWVHEDPRLDVEILPKACASDIGILRLVVEDPEAVKKILQSKGIVIQKSRDVMEVIPDQRGGLGEILRLCEEQGIEVELHSIIPGIYQG